MLRFSARPPVNKNSQKKRARKKEKRKIVIDADQEIDRGAPKTKKRKKRENVTKNLRHSQPQSCGTNATKKTPSIKVIDGKQIQKCQGK